MFSQPRKKKPAPPAAPSPLSAKQQALQAQEAKIKADMERCQKLMEDAPRLAEEQRRRQREEMISRASMTHRPTRPTSVVDRSSILHATVLPLSGRGGRMRAERLQGRLMFFVLLLTLAAALFYLYYTVTHG